MPRYRKRPIVVDAIVWSGDNDAAVAEFVASHSETTDPTHWDRGSGRRGARRPGRVPEHGRTVRGHLRARRGALTVAQLITDTCPSCGATFDAIDDCLAHVAAEHLGLRPVDIVPNGIAVGHSTEIGPDGATGVISVVMLVQAEAEGPNMAAYQTLHLDRAVARHLGTILVEETDPERLALVDAPTPEDT